MSHYKEILMQDSIIIQEIDDYLEENGNDPKSTLILRVLKQNMITMKPVIEHSLECQKNPSLAWKFKNETGKVLVTWGAILGGAYFIFRVVDVCLGLDGFLKALLP